MGGFHKIKTEAFDSPEGWEASPLGEIAKIFSGGAAPQGDRYFDGNNPFVRVQHLEVGHDIVRRWDLITDEAVRNYNLKLFPKGTIVLPKSGASIRLEKRAILPIDAYIVSHLAAIIVNSPKIDRDFLFYQLKGKNLAQKKAEGYPVINLTELKNLTISYPPLSEQRAIAYVLRTVQRAKEATEKVIAAARQLKQSLMRHLFTYGPVSFHETDKVEVKETENGLTMPSKWQLVKVNDLSIKMFGGGTPSTLRPEFWNGDQPWTTSAVIKNDDIYLREYQRRITKDGLMKSSTKIVPKGGILIGTRVGVGKCAVASFDIAISQDLTGIILKPIILPEFFVISMKLPSFQKWFEENKRGATIKGVTRIDVGSLKIPLPSLDEQLYIVDILLKIHNFIEKEEKRVNTLDILFQSFLYILMTGKIRVHDLGFPVTEEAA